MAGTAPARSHEKTFFELQQCPCLCLCLCVVALPATSVASGSGGGVCAGSLGKAASAKPMGGKTI